MSINDPQWGNNKKNDGPPDLEEMLRNFNRKVASLFGGGGNGEGGASGNAGNVIPLILGIIVLIWAASGIYIIAPSERGVELRFGQYSQTTGSGPHWHFPYPIESVEVVNFSKVRTVEVGYRDTPKNKRPQEAMMLTGDENIIDLQFSIQYTLKDAGEFLFNNRMGGSRDKNDDRGNDVVRQAAETAIREVVGKNKIDFVLHEGRDKVASETSRLMQEILDRYKTGIVISQVNMQQAQPPEKVQDAFDDTVRARQDKERQINEGQAYAMDVIPRAKGAAARLTQEAEGYKQAIIANAEGDASRFRLILAEYSKAPQVTRERMYLDMMQQILSNTTKVMVDQKNGSNLLYLPMDKLMQAATQAQPQATDGQVSAKSTESSAQPPAATQKSNEYSLNRDRKGH